MTIAAVSALFRRRGDRRWDWFLRGTVVVALAGVGLASTLPSTIPLVWLAVVSIPANSPLSPMLPTLFEPLIVEAGKVADPWWVSAVALGGYLYTEYLNWHLYAWPLEDDRAAWLRRQPWVRRSVECFARAPFTSVAVFAFTPLPFWVARGLAVLRRYPLAPYLLATALGRWPRFFLYAWLGSAVRIPAGVLLAVIVGGVVVAIGGRAVRGATVLQETVLDAPVDDGSEDRPVEQRISNVE